MLIPALIALATPQQPAAPPPAPIVRRLTMIDRRAAELVAFFNGGGDAAAMFAPALLAQVPEAQLRAVAAQVVAGIGRAQWVRQIEWLGANAATVTIVCERGEVTLKLAVGGDAAGQIVGLLITGTTVAEATLPAVVAALQALPGMTGFALADLGTNRTPRITTALAADRPLAIGSAFKLVILAELVRAIGAGERHWDDLATLDGRELPAGGWHGKPAGTQATLRDLATQMISVSDNSATDVLLRTLGRERVEAMLKTTGISRPALSRPYLSTMEAFKLKGIATLRARWLAADERGRRRLLAEVDAAPTDELKTLFADGRPVAIDRIEWFFSPADTVRVLDWLRRHSETGPGAEARRMLAVNPGIGPAIAARYAYVGYKGGSEPGVISMNLLLQDQAGGWHALAASWNDPAAPIDQLRFIGLVNRAAELAAPR